MYKSPMLLQSLNEPPEDSVECITELKLDGHRMIMSRFNGKTKLYTRHQNEVTAMYPEIINIDIEEGTILDGELIALDDSGIPDFEALQIRSRSKKYINSVPLQFVAFDILYYKNKRVTFKTLLERKKLLATSIPKQQQTLVAHNYVIGQAASYFKLIQDNQLEGIVTKNPYSIYKSNTRSKEWNKIINYSYTDVFVTKIRNNKFGLVATNAEGNYLGLIEYGSTTLRKRLFQMMKVLEEGNDYNTIDPIPCKVKFRNYTNNGLLRIPVLIEVI